MLSLTNPKLVFEKTLMFIQFQQNCLKIFNITQLADIIHVMDDLECFNQFNYAYA